MSYTEQQLVRALYRAVFDRSPDEEGLQRHSEALRTKAASPEDLARTFFHSDEHVLKMCGEARLRDYTQFGELKHVLAILTRTGSRFQFLVDVGARGRDRSNSYNLLCDFGWRGLLIEANPALIDRIDEEFDGLDFQLVNCAVGDQTEKLPFYIGANDDVSSLLADHAEAWGALRGTVEVDVRHLADILDEHDVPDAFDLLSLDIEGMDVRVLNDLVENSAYRPRIVIIEASHEFRTKTLADVGLGAAVQSTYRLAAQTRANLILTIFDHDHS